ncbi:MAG: hypothetical protein ABIR91_04350 [Candidatus Saccharimonadales bacterium]
MYDIQWEEGIREIAAGRHAHADRYIRDLAAAERALTKESAKLQDASKGKGSRGGSTPKFQRAQSAQKAARSNVNRLNNLVRGNLTIDEDQALLVQAIEQFLRGESVPESCGSIRLKYGSDRSKVDLNIYYRSDGKEVDLDSPHHGHLVVRPNGGISYMRRDGDARGAHNVAGNTLVNH